MLSNRSPSHGTIAIAARTRVGTVDLHIRLDDVNGSRSTAPTEITGPINRFCRPIDALPPAHTSPDPADEPSIPNN